MTRKVYSFGELLSLKESPLCVKPDGIPEIPGGSTQAAAMRPRRSIGGSDQPALENQKKSQLSNKIKSLSILTIAKRSKSNKAKEITDEDAPEWMDAAIEAPDMEFNRIDEVSNFKIQMRRDSDETQVFTSGNIFDILEKQEKIQPIPIPGKQPEQTLESYDSRTESKFSKLFKKESPGSYYDEYMNQHAMTEEQVLKVMETTQMLAQSRIDDDPLSLLVQSTIKAKLNKT